MLIVGIAVFTVVLGCIFLGSGKEQKAHKEAMDRTCEYIDDIIFNPKF